MGNSFNSNSQPHLPAVNSNHQIEAILERIDSAVAIHFSSAKPGRQVSSRDTFLKFDPLLAAVFATSAIASPQASRDASLDQATKDFSRFLKPLTYCVASYWSPINKERHSACHVEAKHHTDNRRRAAAALFFAMSHRAGYGREYSPDLLYTATHFLAEHAKRQRSVPIKFDGQLVQIDPNKWQIPSSAKNRWLNLCGWEAILSELAAKFTQDKDYAEKFVRMATAHFEETSRAESDSYGDRALAAFKAAYPTNPEFLTGLATPCVSGLREMWETPHLTEMQAAFMVASYYLWHEAVPETVLAYTFPCKVAKTVCALTAGVYAPLGRTQTALMAWLSKTFFVHPLIRDYAQIVSEDTIREHREMLRRAFGHNVPHMLMDPGFLLLDKIELGLTCAVSVANKPNSTLDAPSLQMIESALECQNAMRLLFNHYNSIVKFLADPEGATSTSKVLQWDNQEYDLSHIEQNLSIFFQQIILPCDVDQAIRHLVSLRFENFAGMCRGNPVVITMFLLNFIKNAACHLSVPKVTQNPDCGIITVTYTDDPDGYSQFTVKDRGNGFNQGIHDRLTKAVEMINTASEENVAKVAIGLMDGHAIVPRRQKSFGIGLLNTIYYLNHLKFMGPPARAGRLDIGTTSDGASVCMSIPSI
jgi:hypothetical protein